MVRCLASVLLRCTLACASLYSSFAEVRHLTILHTNDLHAHVLPDAQNRGGFAQLATMLRREETGGNVIYLNAGDLVQGTPVSTLFQGAPLYEVGNLLHIDAAAFGNHEFDYGWRKALEYPKISKYPMVVANVVDAQDKPIAQPYVMKTVNGIRIAIIGAVMGNLLDYATPQRLGPLRTLPVVETVSRYAKELRQRSDLILVLGHIERKESDAILRDVPDISVVIKGHDHDGTENPVEVQGRIGVWCKAYGVELGRLDLEVDTGEKKLSSWQWRRLPVDAATVPADKDLKKAINQWESRVSKIVDVSIGEARRDYDESALRQLVEEAILSETHADFTYVNAGGIRDRLVKGPILGRNIWNILPFDGQIAVASIPGRLIAAPLRKDRVVEPDRLYTVALDDYLVESLPMRARLGIAGIEFKKTSQNTRDIMIHWIKQKRVLE
jgi:5'-nucleotidase / UDP-sugar diphosphatase